MRLSPAPAAWASSSSGLFQVELEHYEKMEGRTLSLEGKANRLALMVRGQPGRGHAGLWSWCRCSSATTTDDRGQGRIFSYDVAGGPYEEHRFYSIGSGSLFARGALKKLYADGMSAADAVLACVQALYDAADDDSATGGPDLTRRHLPRRRHDHRRRLQRSCPTAEAAQVAEQVVRERLANPDGPPAALRNG